MKAWYNKVSIFLILVSLVYVTYLTYISSSKLLVGAAVAENQDNEVVITNIEEFSTAYYSGIQKGTSSKVSIIIKLSVLLKFKNIIQTM